MQDQVQRLLRAEELLLVVLVLMAPGRHSAASVVERERSVRTAAAERIEDRLWVAVLRLRLLPTGSHRAPVPLLRPAFLADAGATQVRQAAVVVEKEEVARVHRQRGLQRVTVRQLLAEDAAAADAEPNSTEST